MTMTPDGFGGGVGGGGDGWEETAWYELYMSSFIGWQKKTAIFFS